MLGRLQIEKLRLAAEMLPPEENSQKAARLVEQATQVRCHGGGCGRAVQEQCSAMAGS